MKEGDNNFDWLKKNTKIMVDQNIGLDIKKVLINTNKMLLTKYLLKS